MYGLLQFEKIHIRGLIKKSFTWDDTWGKPVKQIFLPTKWDCCHGHLEAEQNIDHPYGNTDSRVCLRPLY